MYFVDNHKLSKPIQTQATGQYEQYIKEDGDIMTSGNLL